MASPFDIIVHIYEGRMAELADRLNSGEIDSAAWAIEMRAQIREAYLLQYRAGAGRDLSADDYLKLGNPIKSQEKFLSGFINDVTDGSVSPAQIVNRAKMYAKSSGQMFWNAATGDVKLPAYPRDGSTPCKSNCGCEWRNNGDGSFTWVRGKNDSCEVCKQRERDWNPFWPAGAQRAA